MLSPEVPPGPTTNDAPETNRLLLMQAVPYSPMSFYSLCIHSSSVPIWARSSLFLKPTLLTTEVQGDALVSPGGRDSLRGREEGGAEVQYI